MHQAAAVVHQAVVAVHQVVAVDNLLVHLLMDHLLVDNQAVAQEDLIVKEESLMIMNYRIQMMEHNCMDLLFLT